MGPYGSKNFRSTIGIFEILNIEILTIFFHFLLIWDPKAFKLVLHFPPQWSTQKSFWDFRNFEFPIFKDFFLENLKFTIVPVEKP